MAKKCNYTVKQIGVYSMKNNKNMSCKTVLEISSLSSLLTPSNQSYVLNTIQALLFSQQVNEEQKKKEKLSI